MFWGIFFDNHLEFSKLIKDKLAYEKWKVTNVDFIDVESYEQRTEYKISDYLIGIIF